MRSFFENQSKSRTSKLITQDSMENFKEISIMWNIFHFIILLCGYIVIYENELWSIFGIIKKVFLAIIDSPMVQNQCLEKNKKRICEHIKHIKTNYKPLE